MLLFIAVMTGFIRENLRSFIGDVNDISVSGDLSWIAVCMHLYPNIMKSCNFTRKKKKKWPLTGQSFYLNRSIV